MSLGTLDQLHVYVEHDVELMAEICGLEHFETTALCTEVRPYPRSYGAVFGRRQGF